MGQASAARAQALGVQHPPIREMLRRAEIVRAFARRADRDADLETVRESRCGDRALDPGDDCVGHRLVRIAEEEPELVAAEASDDVAVADAGTEGIGDGDEQLVAELVTVRVVELLEAAAVDHHDARRRVGAGPRGRDGFVPRQAVCQAGQPVAPGVGLGPVEIRAHPIAHRSRDQKRLGRLDHLRTERLAQHRETSRCARGRVQQEQEPSRRPPQLEQVVGDDAVSRRDRRR